MAELGQADGRSGHPCCPAQRHPVSPSSSHSEGQASVAQWLSEPIPRKSERWYLVFSCWAALSDPRPDSVVDLSRARGWGGVCGGQRMEPSMTPDDLGHGIKWGEGANKRERSEQEPQTQAGGPA